MAAPMILLLNLLISTLFLSPKGLRNFSLAGLSTAREKSFLSAAFAALR